jgi:hypothetical protein
MRAGSEARRHADGRWWVAQSRVGHQRSHPLQHGRHAAAQPWHGERKALARRRRSSTKRHGKQRLAATLRRLSASPNWRTRPIRKPWEPSRSNQRWSGAFEKNFNKNADIALELSQKVDRTGVPILNKWINAGRRSVTGDADLAAFDANIKATVNEYAKIVGGGTGSGATAQGEIAKIEGLLSSQLRRRNRLPPSSP